MHAPVRVTYRESGAHLAEAARQSPVQSRQRTWLWVVVLVATLIFSFGKILWEESRKGVSTPMLVLVVPFVGVVAAVWFFVLRPFFGTGKSNQAYYDKLYRQQTGKDETKVVCEFGEMGFLVTSDGGVASHFPWPTVAKAVEREAGILIFTGPQLFHWFPRTAFASDADFRAVVALIADKVSNFERPRARK